MRHRSVPRTAVCQPEDEVLCLRGSQGRRPVGRWILHAPSEQLPVVTELLQLLEPLLRVDVDTWRQSSQATGEEHPDHHTQRVKVRMAVVALRIDDLGSSIVGTAGWHADERECAVGAGVQPRHPEVRELCASLAASEHHVRRLHVPEQHADAAMQVLQAEEDLRRPRQGHRRARVTAAGCPGLVDALLQVAARAELQDEAAAAQVVQLAHAKESHHAGVRQRAQDLRYLALPPRYGTLGIAAQGHLLHGEKPLGHAVPRAPDAAVGTGPQQRALGYRMPQAPVSSCAASIGTHRLEALDIQEPRREEAAEALLVQVSRCLAWVQLAWDTCGNEVQDPLRGHLQDVVVFSLRQAVRDETEDAAGQGHEPPEHRIVGLVLEGVRLAQQGVHKPLEPGAESRGFRHHGLRARTQEPR
mmetsp:Transcript_13359/g.38991  ORF Transcript_13359/g.38991 Transcript_13359/m.38991 type:complete len:415 (+) Transcript_13359:160-1404(+)